MMNKNIFPDVPDVVHNAVLDALDSLEKGNRKSNNIIHMKKATSKNRRHKPRLTTAAVACAACFLLFGLTASAVGFVNAYKQRMAAMDLESMEKYYQITDAGEADELNRPFTEDEQKRFDELNGKYENGDILPLSEITYIQSAGEYSGTGVAIDTTCRMIYLPQEALTDEELLQIIDLFHKEVYSIAKINEAKLINGADWYSRMTQMSDEEVDEVYLAMFGNNLDVGGGSNRPMSESEKSRLEELTRKYEEEGLYAEADITIIAAPEEYTGTGIALCSKDSMYYFPNDELTDSDILQYIDFQHKTSYCLDRLANDMWMGYRTEYPER